MNLEEYAAKRSVLVPGGVPTPRGKVCETPEEAAAAVREIGPAVVKAQVPTGKRGKSGGIKMADTPEEGVLTLEGKEHLQKRLADAINKVLTEAEGFGGVDNVYFRSLLIQ